MCCKLTNHAPRNTRLDSVHCPLTPTFRSRGCNWATCNIWYIAFVLSHIGRRTMGSRPPSPPFGKGYFSVPFERFVRDEAIDQWTSAFTLLGILFTLLASCGTSRNSTFRQIPSKHTLTLMSTFSNANFRNTAIGWSSRQRRLSRSRTWRLKTYLEISCQRTSKERLRALNSRYSLLMCCQVTIDFNAPRCSYPRAWLRWLPPGSQPRLFVHARKSPFSSASWMYSSLLSCLELHPSACFFI